MRNRGSDVEKALLALNKRGYNVDAFIFNATHWAVFGLQNYLKAA
jgi:hypothetical protein